VKSLSRSDRWRDVVEESRQVPVGFGPDAQTSPGDEQVLSSFSYSEASLD
jgi:hypothetical protein